MAQAQTSLNGPFFSPVVLNKTLTVYGKTELLSSVQLGSSKVDDLVLYGLSTGEETRVRSTASASFGLSSTVQKDSNYSIAAGVQSSAAASGSFALGINAAVTNQHPDSFVWSGMPRSYQTKRYSLSQGCFSIYPRDGVNGFFIGGIPISSIIDEEAYDYIVGGNRHNNVFYNGNTFTTSVCFTNDTVTFDNVHLDANVGSEIDFRTATLLVNNDTTNIHDTNKGNYVASIGTALSAALSSVQNIRGFDAAEYITSSADYATYAASMESVSGMCFFSFENVDKFISSDNTKLNRVAMISDSRSFAVSAANDIYKASGTFTGKNSFTNETSFLKGECRVKTQAKGDNSSYAASTAFVKTSTEQFKQDLLKSNNEWTGTNTFKNSVSVKSITLETSGSASFTGGTVNVKTLPKNTGTTEAASTAFVQNQFQTGTNFYRGVNDFTGGTANVKTQDKNDASTKAASTAFVKSMVDDLLAEIQKLRDGQDGTFELFDIKWSDHQLSSTKWKLSSNFNVLSNWISQTDCPKAYELLSNQYDSVRVYQTDTYSTFGNFSIGYHRSPRGFKIIKTTDSSYNSLYSTDGLFQKYGVCWYYVLDTVNKRFLLPRTKYGFTGVSTQVGNYVSPGLPLPTTEPHGHDLEVGAGSCSCSTVASVKNFHYNGSWYSSFIDYATVRLKEDKIYKSSNKTVQPPATELYLYFYCN